MAKMLPRLRSVQLIIIGLFGLIFLASFTESHVIQKRHDIIESSASIDNVKIPNTNDSSTLENEAPIPNEGEFDYGSSGKDVINNDENNNVNSVQDTKVTSTTDVNNGIEQNFDSHTNHTTNVTQTINSQTNFTKDVSQDDSVENRLPSKISDKPVSSVRTSEKIATVSLKDATKVEDKSMQTTISLRIPSSNPSEKPKRIDTTFARTSDHAMGDLDTSTVPVIRSTAPILTTIPLAPKISVTETIRARISSISPDVAEKRAKFLSETHVSSSPSSNSDASWSDLKTVGEVHHNNVTLGKSLGLEEPIKSVSGKLDLEEIAEKTTLETSSTERNTDDHETQLQKSNSSKVVDVQEDNSLGTFHSNRHTIPVTTKKVPTTVSNEGIHKLTIHEEDESKKVEHSIVSNTKNHESQDVESVKEHGTKLTETSIPVAYTSTERLNNEEITEKIIEKEVYSPTEYEFTTTDIDDETTIIEETTTLSQIPRAKPSKKKDNLVITETTTIIPTTVVDEILTTDVETTTTKVEEEIKVHEPTEAIVIKATSSKSTESVSSSTETVATSTTPKTTSSTTPLITTTQEITKPTTHPTKSIVTKPTSTELNQRIIVPITQEKVSDSTSTTQRNVPEAVTHTNEPEQPKTPVTPQINTAGTGGSLQRKSPNAKEDTENQTEIDQQPNGNRPDINAMIAIGISIIAVVTLILLVGFLYVMRKRQKQLTYGQRCRPIGLDAYSLDNISVYNSVRRKSANRASKRAFGNVGFDDPDLKNNPLNISQLATFSQKRVSINDEFRDVPTVTARIEEVPVGCEDKNRYANVVPLPESRVHLKRNDDDEKTEYINANFVKGPKDTTHYYIACQAPLEHTVIDFWRMIWEQNSRVIIMGTDLTENGIEKCAEYLPSSFVIDNHVTFGDYQIILKNREVRDKYAVSTVHLKNVCTKTWREITHFWYQWPENGVPTDEASVIAMLLEARSYLKMVTPEQSTENGQQESDLDGKMSNGNLDKSKSLQRIQGPLTVHCSPGTGRTGTIIACDIAIRSLEQPTRTVDVPQIVYFVRRGRASAVQTREQYEFIYKVSHVYATKLMGSANDN